MSKEAIEILEAMTDAAQAVVDNWSEGNLAAAVNNLDGCIVPARIALANEKHDIENELAEALELCVDCLDELSRLDDGTPSVSALNLARAALAKAGRA